MLLVIKYRESIVGYPVILLTDRSPECIIQVANRAELDAENKSGLGAKNEELKWTIY